MTPRRLLLVAATGVATAIALHVQRDMAWKLAGIAGVAVAVLGVMALRTADKLRRIWRDPRDPRDAAGDDRDRR